ncbi:deubiquitinating enzyme, partial [Coemansia sp. RSA 2681]
GVYELVGVVTHIGRSANSGHYMGWVRKEKGVGGPEPKTGATTETRNWWYKFDDDEVSMVTDDDILKLCGGGDWHTAYVTLYRAKQLEPVEVDRDELINTPLLQLVAPESLARTAQFLEGLALTDEHGIFPFADPSRLQGGGSRVEVEMAGAHSDDGTRAAVPLSQGLLARRRCNGS